MGNVKTFMPTGILQPFVRSFLITENEEAGSYKVLPGTGLVMGFQFSGHLSYSAEEIQIPLSSSGITGLMDTYRVFNNSCHTRTVLVLFSETGASAFFRQPMHELFGYSLPLDDLLLHSQMDIVSETIREAKTDEERVRAVENFLIGRLDRSRTDQLVSHAVTLIKQHYGQIRIAALAEQLHISQGQFEKRFRKIVGATPKKFASIVRLNSIVRSKGSSLTATALEAGYFDQAHFIKDFRQFAGESPDKFFRRTGDS